MVFNFSSVRLTHSEDEPLKTDDIFTTTCVIRDELLKMEERCLLAQAKSEQLKQQRDELTEVLRLFQVIEENEKNANKQLGLELEKAQGKHVRLCSNLYAVTDSSGVFSTDIGASSAISTDLSLSRDVSVTRPLALSDTPTLPSVPISTISTSTAWRQKLAILIRESRDVSYLSLPSMDGSDITASICKDEEAKTASKDMPSVLGVVTALKNNVGSSLDEGSKCVKTGPAKPKYSGGSALKKTMPHKSRRQSRKPFIPIVLSKARLPLKRKSHLHHPSPQPMEISEPFNFRKVSGASERFGVATMEAIKGSEAFAAGLASLGLGAIQMPSSVAAMASHEV